MPFTLGSASRSRLAMVHPVLLRIVDRAIAISACDFTVMQGVRSLSEQAKHVANGTSKTMNSKHLLQSDGFAHAVDLVPWIDGKPSWDWSGCYQVASAMRLASSDHGVKLVWGGVWDRPLSDINPATALGMEQAHLGYVKAWEAAHAGKRALQDGPHFELQ